MRPLRRIRPRILLFSLTLALLLFPAGAQATESLPNTPLLAGKVRALTSYSFNMAPGATYSNAGILDCLLRCDNDQYIMTVTQATAIQVNVVDCCNQGDKICLRLGDGNGHQRTSCAVSPGSILVNSRSLSPGTYRFVVFYESVVGGLPAGYDIVVRAT